VSYHIFGKHSKSERPVSEDLRNAQQLQTAHRPTAGLLSRGVMDDDTHLTRTSGRSLITAATAARMALRISSSERGRERHSRGFRRGLLNQKRDRQ
jgi:hypothetical protein